MLITVTEGTDYNPEALKIYQAFGELRVFDDSKPFKAESVKDTDVLVIRLKYKLDKKELDKFPNLKYILTPTTGLNHIDLEETELRGISVLSLKGETDFLNQIPSTAEHTWALLLALVRKLVPAVNHVSTNGWNRDLFKGYNLRGKTLGIIGLGRVGRQVARFANAFGMEVQYFDPLIDSETDLALRLDHIEELMKNSDVISIHIPLQKETVKFIDSSLIQLVKPSVWMINTSRGEIWDEDAVAKAVYSHQIQGVATDVLSDEFNQVKIDNNPLIKLQKEGFNVIVTPHIAGATYDSMYQTEYFIADKFSKEVVS